MRGDLITPAILTSFAVHMFPLFDLLPERFLVTVLLFPEGGLGLRGGGGAEGPERET